jgi:serine/threonine protein phosphatase PrpC
MNHTSQLPTLYSAMQTDVGLKRKQNQDSGLAIPELGFFIVADGMGGHQGGEIASQLCVEKFAEYLRANPADASHPIDDVTLLYQALHVANQAIYDQSQRDPHLLGMGTTVTALKISGSRATILQVGDSRAYYWNEKGIWQLTRDHSLVQEKLRAGLITREQAKTDDMKNVITRSVGYELQVKPDLYGFDIAKGDGFLLCSDGLTGFVSDSLMFDILEETVTSGLSLNEALKTASERLISEANRGGGDDNITVVIAAIPN